MKIFDNKSILVTGGTGSFGYSLVKYLLSQNVKEIRVFSRDENKQDKMRRNFSDDRIKYYIGDIRDRSSIDLAIKKIDLVFHAAALKQVPSCEFYPMEAIKTNIFGTDNLIDLAIRNNVTKVVALSTDKAVYPINAMGMSKALMEKVLISKSRLLKNTNSTILTMTRYGNVMGSRGSVIPLFIDQILSGKDITITDPKMTRFLMSLEESVDLVVHAFKNGQNGDLFIQKSPACNVLILAEALMKILDKKVTIKTIGIRHGEKLFESLLSKEEKFKAKETKNFFMVPTDNRELNYEKYFIKGSLNINQFEEYNSNNMKL